MDNDNDYDLKFMDFEYPEKPKDTDDIDFYEGINEDSEYYESKKRPKEKKKKAKTIIKVIVFVILFGASAFIGNRAAAIRWAVHSSLRLVKYDTSGVIQNVDQEAIKDGETLLDSDEIINILLVGADKRESWSEAGRSDSCMIATIDLKHKQLKLTSLMRDMYVDIPGYGMHKFNAAYSYGGVDLLYKTIVSNFGIKVKGYAVVDFAAFKKVIDTLGGVKIKLTQEECDILLSRYHRTSVLKLKPGVNKMNGTQALAYCRLRQDKNADFGRTQRQRYVISQILKKMKTKPIRKWNKILEAAMPEVTTDISEDMIYEYMKDVILIGNTEIEQFRIPIEGSYHDQSVAGSSVLGIDVEQNREAVKKFIFGEDEDRGDKKEESKKE